MLVKAVHRENTGPIPFGRLIWHKTFARHTELHYDLAWSPPFFVALFITEGCGHFRRADGFAARIQAGDVLLLFAGMPSGLKAGDGHPLDFLLYGFDGPVFRLWESSGLLAPDSPCIALGAVEPWRHRWLTIPLPEQANIPDREMTETCRLQQMLSEMRQAGLQRSQKAPESWVDRVYALLEATPRQHFRLENLAESMHMPPETFRKQFRRHFGMGPKRYYDKLLGQKACELLCADSQSHWHIAAQLGFPDEFTFSRFFKRTVGIAPALYRASTKEQMR